MNLREESGAIDIDSKLVSFLYELMRDHLTPGVIEGLVQNAQEQPTMYTNGWLALYAANVAQRLTSTDAVTGPSNT